MRLPRWLVIAMLTSSVLAVLAAAGWWWVTWPERTAQMFFEMSRTERWEEAAAVFRGEEPKDVAVRFVRFQDLESDSVRVWTPEPRTVYELIVGRGVFSTRNRMPIIVERGIVRWANYDEAFGRSKQNTPLIWRTDEGGYWVFERLPPATPIRLPPPKPSVVGQ